MPDESRVVCIMRRYKPRLPSWAWKGSFLAKSTPDDRTFELLDAAGNKTGQLIYTDYRAGSRAKAQTPWGEATVTTGGGFLRNGSRGFLTVVLGERIVAIMEPHLLRWDFSFPDRSVMSFRMRPGKYSLEYAGDTGSVTVLEEERGAPELERPKSVKANRFQQWTISFSGILPVDERDVVTCLVMFASLEKLDFEDYGGC